MIEQLSLIFSDTQNRMGELIIDGFLSETYEFCNELTTHPVESGYSFVDHIHNKPISLQLEGVISNTPMSFIGLQAIKSATNFFNGKSNDLLSEAFLKIEDIFAKREVLTICTSMKEYQNMVLESLTIEKNNNACLRFSCTAKQIRVVEQMFIKIVEKPKIKRAQEKVKMLKILPKTLEPENIKKNKSKSVLHSLIF